MGSRVRFGTIDGLLYCSPESPPLSVGVVEPSRQKPDAISQAAPSACVDHCLVAHAYGQVILPRPSFPNTLTMYPEHHEQPTWLQVRDQRL
jgi:hypothetical protein